MELSPREAEVLAALGEHLTNAEIAARLFISIRTVESHVSSLLRKLGASDRRALATLAAQRNGGGSTRPEAPRLPSPLTSFVGRAGERAALVAALRENRLVTAVGPGGVGKTRLALAVAAEVTAQFPDGAWYVDLVPVTDDGMVADAVAAALGLGEQHGRSAAETIATWAAERRLLLVLDNCEHLADGVAVLVERLLGRSPGLTVLTTSRARLVLPFERAFPLDGLSRADDAVALFVERATVAGAPALDRARVERICTALDGVPLAIELAAARLPAVGLDGLEAGLADRLPLLVGARRVDERHRSLRSALDWSAALLDEDTRAVLRRLSVFAGTFSADAAAAVVGMPGVGARLAQLVDHSLLVRGTRYSMLETVRQYGAELLAQAGELDEYRARHLRWCIDAGAGLMAADVTGAHWRADFDRLADELRRALGWAVSVGRRVDAHDSATVLAALCHRRGMLREARRRSEQAAELAGSELDAAAALRRAAGSAAAGLGVDDAIGLYRVAADAALRAGAPTLAARDLARAAELVYRAPGVLPMLPAPDVSVALLADARRHADGDPVALARIAVAEVFVGWTTDIGDASAIERAVDLAERAGDPLVESAALDRFVLHRQVTGDVRAALEHARRRTEMLAGIPHDAEVGFELSDAYKMATQAALAAGDLATAREMATACRQLPLDAEHGHVATDLIIVVTSLIGDWDETLAHGSVFLDGWEAAGRPRLSSLRRAARSMATVHALRGQHASRERWLAVVEGLTPLDRPLCDERVSELFEALLLLHDGHFDEAASMLAADVDDAGAWPGESAWRTWYAALAGEATVLGGRPDAAQRLAAARMVVEGNPVAVALVQRAEALVDGHSAGVRAAGEALKAAGCRYQWARSRWLAGDGDEALSAMGATTHR